MLTSTHARTMSRRIRSSADKRLQTKGDPIVYSEPARLSESTLRRFQYSRARFAADVLTALIVVLGLLTSALFFWHIAKLVR